MTVEAHISRATTQVIRGYLQLSEFAITGLLGSGKTQCLERDIVGVAKRDGWKVCSIDRHESSPVRVFKKLASQIRSRNFDKAFRNYTGQFQPTDQEIWLRNIKAVASVWDAFVALVGPAFPILALAMEVGSKALPPEQFARIVSRMEAQTGKKLAILAANPLQYLADALKQDLGRLKGNERIVLIIDDYELVGPLLQDWLDQFRETAKNITLILVCWNSQLLLDRYPYGKELQMLDLDKHLMTQDDISRLWFGRYPAQSLTKPDTLNLSLPFSGSSRIFVVNEQEDQITNSASKQTEKFQGPPTFGLPVFASSFPKRGRSHKVYWQPMLDHLMNWLEFYYPDKEKAEQVLHCLIEYSVARYLDEGVVLRLTPDWNLYSWLYSSPLLISRSVCNEQRRVFDPRLRCVFLYELYFRDRARYYSLHENLTRFYEEVSIYPGYHDIEIWYHSLLHTRDLNIWQETLNRFLDGLYNDRPQFPSGYILEVLSDICLENPNTLSMRDWEAPTREAYNAYTYAPNEVDWKKGVLPFLTKIMEGESLNLLTPLNRERLEDDYSRCRED